MGLHAQAGSTGSDQDQHDGRRVALAVWQPGSRLGLDGHAASPLLMSRFGFLRGKRQHFRSLGEILRVDTTTERERKYWKWRTQAKEPDMSKKTFKQECHCQNCGNEAEMTITCELKPQEEKALERDESLHLSWKELPGKPKGEAVCTQCGNEADIWLDI
jgi:hypothetical protein